MYFSLCQRSLFRYSMKDSNVNSYQNSQRELVLHFWMQGLWNNMMPGICFLKYSRKKSMIGNRENKIGKIDNFIGSRWWVHGNSLYSSSYFTCMFEIFHKRGREKNVLIVTVHFVLCWICFEHKLVISVYFKWGLSDTALFSPPPLS